MARKNTLGQLAVDDLQNPGSQLMFFSRAAEVEGRGYIRNQIQLRPGILAQNRGFVEGFFHRSMTINGFAGRHLPFDKYGSIKATRLSQGTTSSILIGKRSRRVCLRLPAYSPSAKVFASSGLTLQIAGQAYFSRLGRLFSLIKKMNELADQLGHLMRRMHVPSATYHSRL